MSFNKITMVGNVGRDPELRRLPDGATVCNFNVAVNEATRPEIISNLVSHYRLGRTRGYMRTQPEEGSAVYVAQTRRDCGKTNKANVT